MAADILCVVVAVVGMFVFVLSVAVVVLFVAGSVKQLQTSVAVVFGVVVAAAVFVVGPRVVVYLSIGV